MQKEVRGALDGWLSAHDGVISGTQARRLGISNSGLYRLVDSEGLHRVAAGVFVDPSWPANPRTSLRSALLAAGSGAIVSHRSAAWLWRLVEPAPRRPSITIPHVRHGDRPLGAVHSTRNPPVRRQQAGFPVTDPVRTLVDLAATAGSKPLDVLIDRALSLRLVSVERLDAATRPQPRSRQPGVRNLRRRLLLRGHLEAPTPSVLEAHMGRLLRNLEHRHAIPPPRPEVRIEGGRYRLDYAWPEVGLAAEVDGYVWHSSAEQLRHDHDRRNQLVVDWTVLVFTWVQVVHEPDQVMSQIAVTYRRLARRGRR